MQEYAIVELPPTEAGGYAPRGAVRELWHSKAPEVVVSGPAETGKTYGVLQKLDALMWTYPGAQAAIVRKTYQSMPGSVLATYRKVLGKESPVRPYGGEKPEWYDYPNGSRVYVGGMDNPNKVLSAERDVIFVNQAEELELADWEVLTTRCTGRAGNMPYAQMVGDCNPGPPTHWILHRPSLQVLYSRHEDNPALYDEGGNLTEQGRRSMAVLDRLTGTRKERLRFGKWVSAEGVVYEAWDRGVHLVDAATLQEWGIIDAEGKLNWDKIKRVIGSLDWGFTNPGVLQVWALDNDRRMFLIHEIYRSKRLIDWWVREAWLLKERYGIDRFYADPSEPQYIKQMRDGRLPVWPAQNDIGRGIQAVQERLPVQKDGRARLYIYQGGREHIDEELAEQKKPTSTVEELDLYVWARNQDGTITKEKPVDENNHGMDAMRYAAMAALRRGGVA